LRAKSVRDIETQETQYPEKFWLNNIPENELFENIIRSDFDSNNEYWLKIRKPKGPEKPEFNKLSESLELWIDRATLFNEDALPELKESVELNGETIELHTFPEVNKELQDYIEQNWIDDLIDFNTKDKIYNIKNIEYEKLNSVYKTLFRIFNKTQQFGEEYELVIGVGLLNFKENDSSPKIFRHILTQRVDINFEYSQKKSEILITPNLESSPQIETDSILDLNDQFESQNIIDAEKAVQNYLKEKNVETVFDATHTENALQIFAERFSPEGSYKTLIDKPSTTNSKPIVSYSPALLLRKRNTRSLTSLYDTIIENIENKGASIEIPIMNDVIGVDSEFENNIDNDINSNNKTNVEPIFFPKEFNDEQIEIIEKAKKNNKVLVQGPPGTGKSHTIANLICHLLANGKKVLVTAYTKRALEVLKEKLPEEFQNLTVNLLSGDSSSVQDLQSSVNSINEELSSASLSTYKRLIDKYETELKVTRQSIAESKYKLVAIKEKTTRNQEINKEYKGTLAEIAQNIERDLENFDWYEDDFCDIENTEIIEDLKIFIALNKQYNEIDEEDFSYSIPELNRLPPTKLMSDYFKLSQKVKTEYNLDENLEKIKCSSISDIIQKLKELQGLNNSVEKIQIDFADLIIVGNSKLWNEKTEETKSIISRIEKYDVREIDKNIEIKYPADKSLKQLKNDAQILFTYLKDGHQLSGVSFSFKRPFLSKQIKEKLYFIEAVTINGSPCDTKEEFIDVLKDISFTQDFDELADIWKKKVPDVDSIYKKLMFFKNINSEVITLNGLVQEIRGVKNKIEEVSNLKINPYDKADLIDKIKQAEFNQLSIQIAAIKTIIDDSIIYLNQENTHPIREIFFESYAKTDHAAYAKTIEKIEQLAKDKINFERFQKLKLDLSNNIPKIIETVEKGSFLETDLEKLNPAIFYRHAESELKKLTDKNEKLLIRDLSELEKKEQKLIAKLASKKAWYHVVEGLQKNRSLRQELNAWVSAVKKIGKTGKGKKALKFRKIAQKHMQQCKDSIPCWIMPLYKVAETIQPEQEMYDYVIIDEASQLGPDALFLLYISKKVIIVGDDKQTSPEYIGVTTDTMNPHIKRHLNEIPYSDFYGPEFSFFDHAKLFCDGEIVLREHFRCMPEIIEFSNRNFYAPDGKGLYPLKQYSQKRLEPLESVYCKSGYTEGRASTIINEPEANEIINTIENLICDERYNGKTFGIITLQGNKQSDLIENLIINRIGEKEFHKRKIVCGNSASFQGDERDIIFLSLVTAHNHNRKALVKPEDERRFNVAASRAKEQVWLFHSIQLEDLSNTNDLRYKLLNHFKNYDSYQPILKTPIKKSLGTQPEPFDSWFEVDVYNDLVSKQLSVIPQYKVAKGRFIIDLVALFPDGTKIGIECDGGKWHGAEHYEKDMMRQKVLERCGWQIFRVRDYEYYTNRKKALEPLWKMVHEIEETKNLIQQKESLQSQNKTTLIENPTLESSSEISDRDIPLIKEEIIEKKISALKTDKILRYLNLYNSGTYVLTENDSLKADYVISISENQRLGFLMQCYSSGHINKVNISALLEKKIGKEYKNGINKNQEITSIKVIEADKILGIYFYQNGKKSFKAHHTKNISSRDQLHLQGYKVIYNDFENISFDFIQLEYKDDIKKLIYQSFTANGKSMNNNYFKEEWQTLKKINSTNKIDEQVSEEENTPSLFDNISNPKANVPVKVNDTVKIKYLNGGKILTIKLVDYNTKGVEKENNVQLLNIRTLLGDSIKGRVVGDKIKFKIKNIKNTVEIIEII
tara:strand:- start:131 stop:5470 length:5340 start_codon:yes stop_codon:yes gene_type:complete